MRLLLTVALVGAIVAGAITLVAGADQDNQAMPQPWGTWVWRTHTPSGAALPTLVTYHQDGTIAGSDFSMFGGTVSNLARRATPLNGVWERTGPRTIGGTCLYLVFDASTNLLIGFGRARSALEFTPGDFDQFEGRMFVDFLACPTPSTCPDPLDQSAAWTSYNSMVPDGFVVSAKRLHRVEAGPL